MTPSATCAIGQVSRIPSYYRAEQYDSDLGLYYLRARYYNPLTGRFLSRDPEDGRTTDPRTRHKYLYADGGPVNGWDPTGRLDEEEVGILLKKIPKVVAVLVTCATFANEAFKAASELVAGTRPSDYTKAKLKLAATGCVAAVVWVWWPWGG